jgi:hypothetical protein
MQCPLSVITAKLQEEARMKTFAELVAKAVQFLKGLKLKGKEERRTENTTEYIRRRVVEDSYIVRNKVTGDTTTRQNLVEETPEEEMS